MILREFILNDPKNESRDRIILSKGHNGVAIYAALAEMGFYDIDKLNTYGDNGGWFSSHISHKLVPGGRDIDREFRSRRLCCLWYGTKR